MSMFIDSSNAVKLPPAAFPPVKTFDAITADLGNTSVNYKALSSSKQADATMLTSQIADLTEQRDAALAVSKKAADTSAQIDSILAAVTVADTVGIAAVATALTPPPAA